MPRTTSLTAALVAAAVVVAGCSHGGAKVDSGFTTLPTLSKSAASTISQRYQSAVGPANTALSEVVARALQYAAGSTVSVQALVPSAESALSKAIRELNGISAPQVLRTDLATVVADMNAVTSDLMALGSTKGGSLQPVIARLVADSGRVSASENVAQLEVNQLSQPAAAPAPILPSPSTAATTTTTTTTRRSSSRRTTTTSTPSTSTSTSVP